MKKIEYAIRGGAIMKATGITRRLDYLGRIVIPRELRKTLRLRDGDPMELFIEDGNVVLKKYEETATTKDIIKDLRESIRKGKYSKEKIILEKINEIESLLEEKDRKEK